MHSSKSKCVIMLWDMCEFVHAVVVVVNYLFNR